MNGGVILFDNDGTLYEAGDGFKNQVIGRMVSFIQGITGLSHDQVLAARRDLIKKYGIESTEYVFSKEYGVNVNDFVDEVYDVNCSDLGISPDLKLRSVLEGLDARKIIYTNNNSVLAEHILESLGILDLFELIIGIETLDYTPKPKCDSFQKVLAILDKLDCCGPVYFVDDSLENLVAAKEFGIITILISNDKSHVGEVDYYISSIYDLGSVI